MDEPASKFVLKKTQEKMLLTIKVRKGQIMDYAKADLHGQPLADMALIMLVLFPHAWLRGLTRSWRGLLQLKEEGLEVLGYYYEKA
ncbi:unnamed protein product [Caretta caretta]